MQRVMTVLVILPFWTSYLLRVYAWMTILGERGLINRTLMGVGILDEPVRFLLYNNYAVVIVSVYLYIPYCVLALYTALERLDTSLFSAAMDLGARPRQVFLHVMLPLGPARRVRVLHLRLHPDGRRIRHAHPGRRRSRHDDRECRSSRSFRRCDLASVPPWSLSSPRLPWSCCWRCGAWRGWRRCSVASTGKRIPLAAAHPWRGDLRVSSICRSR